MKVLSYLSAPRLDTKQNKYQRCQHPAKRKFYVFRLFSEGARRRKQELDTGILLIFIQTCNLKRKKKKESVTQKMPAEKIKWRLLTLKESKT